MNGELDAIIRHISESDPRAFRELFDHYSPKVYGFALKITRSESIAEEMVQEVFMKIWQNRRDLRSVEYFPAYLFTVTKNFSLNVLKRLATEEKAKRSFAEDLHVVHSDTEETVIYRDYHNILSRAIDCLPPQQKLVYSLCRGEGLKYEEVAEKLRISRFTVKTHMQQALRNIKSHFTVMAKTILPLIFSMMS